LLQRDLEMAPAASRGNGSRTAETYMCSKWAQVECRADYHLSTNLNIITYKTQTYVCARRKAVWRSRDAAVRRVVGLKLRLLCSSLNVPPYPIEETG
jgi:hypothetical protein